MNILIPHRWLLEHVKTQIKPAELQKFVSLCGPSVERIYERGNDEVYDIEVTTNRVDSMSVRGIARETAVILEEFGIPAKLTSNDLILSSIPTPQKDDILPLPKIVDPKNLCKRTLCVVLRNVERTATPKWMNERLTQVEIGIHDSAIDITNYVTHELGHPIHAFDYDQIMKLGGEIHVSEAKKGDTFITLDKVEYSCVGGEIVFKNQHGDIIDLPAIKGTANTSLRPTTKNILLWVESIDPAKVRFSSMTHAIRTVAAQLSEKGIDPHLAEPTFVKAVQLYQELCHASVASPVLDSFPDKEKPQTILVDLQKIHTYLGVEIELSKVVEILQKLECEVSTAKNTLHITPPTFRKDLSIPADIVEEIARIYGYHKLPSVLMPTRIPLNRPKNVNFDAEEKIKHFLADVGWFEVYTYSMVSEAVAKKSHFPIEHHLALANALTEDKVYLRRSLIPSLEEVITNNPQDISLSVFELAHVYHPQKEDLPNEALQIGMVSLKPLREVKGDLENLLEQFYISPLHVEADPDMRQGKLIIEGEEIGKIWVNGKKTCIEIAMKQLLPHIQSHPNYQPLPKTASVKEQLTFTLPEKTALGPIISFIENLDKNIKQVSLGETYQKNVTFHIEYWNSGKNLSNEEIKPIREKIVEKVQKKFSAELVGKL